MSGSDLWWHVAAGRHIVEHPRLPLLDPWSYTHLGRPWLHHEWLADVVFHGWTALLGLPSLVYWKWGMIVATFALIERTLTRIVASRSAGYLGALTAAAVAESFLDVRPHLYSLLGYALLLWLTLGRPRMPRALPLLFLVWANVHGGVFFGLLALAWVLVASCLQGREPWPRAGRLFAACVLASLLNPNGVGILTYPLRYALAPSQPYRMLAEWLPPSLAGGIRSPLYPYALGLSAAAALYLGLDRKRREGATTGLGLAALTMGMSLASRRFVPLFAVSQSLLLAPILSALLPRLPVLLAPLLALAFGLQRLLPYPQRPYAFHYLTAEASYPVETLTFMEVNGLGGNVFADYRWGGYIHLRTQGRLKVFIDGRADTVFDGAIYLQYLAVLDMHPGWQEIIESSPASYFLWPRTLHSWGLVQTGRWRVLYEDAVSTLLVREGVPLPPLRSTPESAYRELGLGTRALEERRLAEAGEHFGRALELVPHLSAACDGLARTHALAGRYEDALASIERCQSLFPEPARSRAFRNWLDRLRAALPDDHTRTREDLPEERRKAERVAPRPHPVAGSADEVQHDEADVVALEDLAIRYAQDVVSEQPQEQARLFPGVQSLGPVSGEDDEPRPARDEGGDRGRGQDHVLRSAMALEEAKGADVVRGQVVPHQPPLAALE